MEPSVPSKELEGLCLEPSSEKNRVAAEKKNAFLDVFTGAGLTVFRHGILPYLSLDDVVNGSHSCRLMSAMCHTYTVGDVLSLHSMDHIARNHRIALGRLVMGFVSPDYNSEKLHRRRIIERSSQTSFWARLYHPAVLPDIALAMAAYFHRHNIEFDAARRNDFDPEANKDPETPILVRATYGRAGLRHVDVTIILRFLLMRQGNRRLVLKPPPNGPRYWYNYLFGDPCYQAKKCLTIVVRLEGREGLQMMVFQEDQRIDRRLRITANKEEGVC